MASTKSLFIKKENINREYSWMQFNRRVLEQSMAEENPLLERCRFLSIFSSNLDEFFMVRVGTFYNQHYIDPKKRENKTQLTAREQINGILAEAKKLYKFSYSCYKNLRTSLKKKGINIVSKANITAKQMVELEDIFKLSILPLLSPMVLDTKHPLMRFENKQTYYVYKLKRSDREMVGIMPTPTRLPKLFELAESGKKQNFIALQDILELMGHKAFNGYTVSSSVVARVIRNADFEVDESDADSEYDYDFANYLREKIEMRANLDVVRLELIGANSDLKSFLLENLGVKEKYCFDINGYFDYSFLNKIDSFLIPKKSDELKFVPFKGHYNPIYKQMPLMEYVQNNDIFLAYPYDSMKVLIDLLGECAVSKNVTSIRITIYRLDKHSRIVDALKVAAENGIEVTVVIELCARFDEENNLYYSRILREAGCTIIYGVGNYKVHSKIISITTENNGKIGYITHLGTGNYNEGTANLYTDFNVITADEKIGQDGATFFRNLSIANVDTDYNKLLIAPSTLKSGLMKYIEREIEKAERGEDAYILCKMNSLTDRDMIAMFIKASQTGVKIDLIIRGICCLCPQIKGITENIRVVSIVGRLLEHSRVYAFGGGDDREVFISSADLMTRNTKKRVEIATPIGDKAIQNKIVQMLHTMLEDNVKAQQLGSGGTYTKNNANSEKLVNSQEKFILEH